VDLDIKKKTFSLDCRGTCTRLLYPRTLHQYYIIVFSSFQR